MLTTVDANTVMAGCALLGTFGNTAFQFVRWKIGEGFASKKNLDAVSARVTSVETRILSLPSHSDIQAFTSRMGAVEAKITGIEASMQGVRETMNARLDGVENLTHQVAKLVDLLMQNELEGKHR